MKLAAANFALGVLQLAVGVVLAILLAMNLAK